MSEPTCETCRRFRPYKNYDETPVKDLVTGKIAGTCHALPPISSSFPRVLASDFCGEHQARKDKSDE